MVKLKLLTQFGEYVVTVLVPAFIKMPECIIWGSRHFMLNAKGEYREGCAFVAFSESEAAAMFSINLNHIPDYKPSQEQ